ncbi:acyltransferase family protein [Pseudomonas abieticivorans]|uniref:acyltransferase family protein n=1 Tax=Pseudomonas abieticivorans TaxID=2931382 RepID=UPI0020BF7277|nr:acyltransferase family protein [Pseudomonas sp. PIA16]
MPFNANINALRALAVMAVVLFHFNPALFHGGFIGVDVFFVISGYLMTGIVFSGLENRSFSLLRFYMARARRIIPALMGLCIALMVLGFLYLPIDDYRAILRAIKSSLLFTSNFELAKSGGYFDAPPQENWLLHTWSLSVEWQFYLLYPIAMMAGARWLGLRKLKMAVVALTVASLLASIAMTQWRETLAFYMLPSRAWELLMGGMAFLFPLRRTHAAHRLLVPVGLVGIVGSALLLSSEAPWPGYLALLPVLSTLIVVYGDRDSLLGKLGILQWAGRISYSVYLWHWPLVVVLYLLGLLNSWQYMLGGIALSFALGHVSWRYIERHEKPAGSPRKTLGVFAGATVAVVVLASVTASLLKDHPGARFFYTEPVAPLEASERYPQTCTKQPFDSEECTLGKGAPTVILMGDSHAHATASAVQRVNPGSTLLWWHGGCPLLLDFDMHNKTQASTCRDFNRDKLERLKQSYPGLPLVLFSRASLYADTVKPSKYTVSFEPGKKTSPALFAKRYIDEYTNTVCALASNRPVYLVRPIPEMPFNVYKGLNLRAQFASQVSDVYTPQRQYAKRNEVANQAIDQAVARCGAKAIDPTAYLCQNGKCMGSLGGVALYHDDNHLVDAGDEQLKDLFVPVFKNQSN